MFVLGYLNSLSVYVLKRFVFQLSFVWTLFQSHLEGDADNADKNTEEVSKETCVVWEPCLPFGSHCIDVHIYDSHTSSLFGSACTTRVNAGRPIYRNTR